MSRRGHRLGLISTFYTTWVVKADGKGTVWVSPGIPHSADANETGEVTVTQVIARQRIASHYLVGSAQKLLLHRRWHAMQQVFCVWLMLASQSYVCIFIVCGALPEQALLFASLSNIESRMEPYTTAKEPGGQPISRAEAHSRRARAQQALAQGGLGEQPDVASPGPSSIQQQGTMPTAAREVSLPAAALYLTCRLAPSVFLGW